MPTCLVLATGLTLLAPLGSGPAAAEPTLRAAAVSDRAPEIIRRGTAPAPSAQTRAAVRRAAAAVQTPQSVWDVQFSGSMSTTAQTGQAEKAFRRAAQVWAGLVSSPVPIKVAVTFAPTDPGVLGSTNPATSYAGRTLGDGTSYYPSALADALLGRDVAPSVQGAPPVDIEVTVSSTEPDVYYGTDGAPGSGQVDFETVSLHELGHGLGLLGGMAVSGGTGTRDTPPSIYDTFTKAGGQRLLSIPDGSAALASALTSSSVVWDGPHAVSANGGNPVSLYSPSPWQDGSSYSHLDEATYPAGSPNALMTPFLSPGEVERDPGGLALGMLQDMGWSVTTSGAPAPALSDLDLRYAQDARLRAVLGAPTDAEQVTGDVHYRSYAGGRLYTSSATGVRSVQGAILGLYLARGGTSALGLPVTDETTTPDGVGRYNDFTSATSLYWSGTTGVHVVGGAIRSIWLALGGAAGPAGLPITDELGTPDGVGRYNHFSRGASVYWTPATGAHEIIGNIRAAWAASGWEAGPAGYPVTDEGTTPDRVGRFNHFSKGASIYWTPATGAHLVYGLIRARWAAAGWEAGPVGYPTSDELGAPDRVGRLNHFSRGDIWFSPATGAHSVQGSILGRWAALGAASGYLGYPVTDEFAVPGGRQSNFTGGYVVWNPSGALRDSRY